MSLYFEITSLCFSFSVDPTVKCLETLICSFFSLFLFFCHLCLITFVLQVYQCPLCKKTFQKRPDLQINRTLREITDQFKSMNDGVALGKNKNRRKGGRGAFIQELKKKLPKSSSKENTEDMGESQCREHRYY